MAGAAAGRARRAPDREARVPVTAELVISPRFRGVTVAPPVPDARTIVVTPGRAFGDGHHETTQLCVQAVGALGPRDRPWTFLDWGSGSGILSIAAVKLGATAIGIDIDDDANVAAARNALLSGVTATFGRDPVPGTFDLVVANILRDVLLALAEAIVANVGGTLVLSGLVGTDVPAITARYAPLLAGRRPEVYERGSWRALVWRSLLWR